MISKQDFNERGFTAAEVEILVRLERMSEKLDTISADYVKRMEFEPVQKLVYGLVGVVLIAVVGAIVALIIS
jgi:hypothetical protein